MEYVLCFERKLKICCFDCCALFQVSYIHIKMKSKHKIIGKFDRFIEVFFSKEVCELARDS